MRSGAQITRTPREWHDHQAEERRRTLAALLAELRRARAAGEEWYAWVASGMPELTREEYARRQAPGANRRQRGRAGRKA